MRIVLDTNVLVAAFLRPTGFPARLLRLVLQGHVELVVNEAILSEYCEVLFRPKFQLPRRPVETVLRHLGENGVRAPAYPGRIDLPDVDDQPFLDAALAAGADALITGNRKHFPPELCRGVKVLTPAEFFEAWSVTP